MTVKGFIGLIIATLLAASAGCTIDNEHRCPKGQFYVPEIKSCCLDGQVYDPNEPKLCIPIPEDAGTDTDGDGGVNGIGTECTDDSGCEGLDAEYCAINPGTGTGYCSVLDCTTDICPTGYQCCDCTGASMVPQVVVCLTDADSSMVGQVGCTCE